MARRDIRTVVSLDGSDKYVSAVGKINKEQKLLRTELKAYNSQASSSATVKEKLSKNAENLSKQIALQKKKVDETRHAVEESTRKYGENSDATVDLKTNLAKAEASLGYLKKQLGETTEQLRLQESGLYKVGDALENAGGKMKTIGEKTKTVGSTMTRNLTLPLVAVGTYSAKMAMDFEHSFADVRKTIDATEEEFAGLETGIRNMAKEIPSSTTELNAIASAAGQLGIENENILTFTRTMADLSVAAEDLSATEVATSLAQFANITRMSQTDFDKLGSTITDLGNNLATSEGKIIDMGMRLAGAGTQIGLTEAEIFGLAGALSSVGIEADAGGSAFSKVMANMQIAVETGNESLGDFAKVSGMTAAEFKKAFQEDASGAIISFVEGLGKAEESGESAIVVLEEMGISEVRMRDALLRSAGAGDLMRESIERSSVAWEENTALTTEAEEKAKSTQNQAKMSKQRIDDVAITIGTHMLPVLASAAESVAKVTEGFSKLSPEMQKNIVIAGGVVAGLGPVVRTVGSVTGGLGKATSAAGGFLKKLAEKSVIEGATTATGGFSAATSGLTGMLNPVTLILTAVTIGIAALAAAMYFATEDTRKMNEKIASVGEGAKAYIEGIDGAKSALDGFNDSTALSSEKQQKLQDATQKAQDGITELTNRAVTERRALTQEEFDRMKELIDQLGEFADAQIEVYEQKGRILETMVAKEKNMTTERSQEIIKAAHEVRDQTIAAAEARKHKEYQVADELKQQGETVRDEEKQALIQQAGEIERLADEKYEKELAGALGQTTKIISATQERYMKQNEVDVNRVIRYEEISNQLNDIADEKMQVMNTIREEDYSSLVDYQRDVGKAMAGLNEEEAKLKDERKYLWDDSVVDVASAMVGMISEIKDNRGELSFESQQVALGIIDAFETLPEDQRENVQEMLDTLKEVMKYGQSSVRGEAEGIGRAITSGIVTSLNGNKQTVIDAARGIAKSSIGAISATFEIRSPSRVMKRIGHNVVGTLADTLEEDTPMVAKTAARMAKGIIESAKQAENIDMSFVPKAQILSAASTFSATRERAAAQMTDLSSGANQQSPTKNGDIVIPIYVNGEFDRQVIITSEELARKEKLRALAVGVRE